MSFSAPPLPPNYGALQVWWEQVRSAIGTSFTDIEALIADVAQAQADAADALADATQALTDAAAAATAAANAATAAANAATAAANAQTTANTAQSTATTANTAAGTAQTTADTVKRDTSIATGYTIPAEVLAAADVGATATITIAAHTRRYGDIADVSVNSGSLPGLAFSTTYYVYYDQTSRAGGAVTYVSTTNANIALPQKAAGRHFVGSVTTPADGGGSTSGGANPPSGGGGVDKSELNIYG